MKPGSLTLDATANGQLVTVIGGDGDGQLSAIGVLPGRLIRVGRRVGSTCVVDVRSARGPWHRVAVSRSLASGVHVAPVRASEEGACVPAGIG